MTTLSVIDVSFGLSSEMFMLMEGRRKIDASRLGSRDSRSPDGVMGDVISQLFKCFFNFQVEGDYGVDQNLTFLIVGQMDDRAP